MTCIRCQKPLPAERLQHRAHLECVTRITVHDAADAIERDRKSNINAPRRAFTPKGAAHQAAHLKRAKAQRASER